MLNCPSPFSLSLPKNKTLPSLFFNKEMELSLVGLQNAGKTSLVGVLATGAFQEVRWNVFCLFFLFSRERLSFRRAKKKNPEGKEKKRNLKNLDLAPSKTKKTYRT